MQVACNDQMETPSKNIQREVEEQTELRLNESPHSKEGSPSTDGKSTSTDPNSHEKAKTKKSSTEIKQLFQQHYCSTASKEKHKVPSAGAIR